MRQPKKKKTSRHSAPEFVGRELISIKQFSPPPTFFTKKKNAFKNSIRFLRLVSSIPFKKLTVSAPWEAKGEHLGSLYPLNSIPELPNARITGKPPFLAFGHQSREVKQVETLTLLDPSNPQVPGMGIPGYSGCEFVKVSISKG